MRKGEQGRLLPTVWSKVMPTSDNFINAVVVLCFFNYDSR